MSIEPYCDQKINKCSHRITGATSILQPEPLNLQIFHNTFNVDTILTNTIHDTLLGVKNEGVTHGDTIATPI